HPATVAARHGKATNAKHRASACEPGDRPPDKNNGPLGVQRRLLQSRNAPSRSPPSNRPPPAGTLAAKGSRIMQRITRRASVGLALLAVPFSTNIAHAQSGLDPIVVTASRFPEHRLDAPIGTRVITADEISDSTAHTVPDVLSKLGGVHVRDSSGSPD